MADDKMLINSNLTDFRKEKDINLKTFARLCEQEVRAKDFPLASKIEKKIPIYHGHNLTLMIKNNGKQTITGELYHCLKEGPGIFVIKGFYPDIEVVNRSTELFLEIIQEEKSLRTDAGDHFAKAGENERIWNSFQKICEKEVSNFIDYYKKPLYALVSEAWLGPGYQITAQVNVVKPGGQSQSVHRDYHLGFQSNETVAQYPLALQIASQYLTLQGAIVHTDMPLETGPTLFLPFSQKYDLGYLAWRDSKFRHFFEENAIQLPLEKGDAVFFSPALFHAAGSNTTQKDRIANLIQVSSAFGKTMETINRYKMMRLAYPVLLEKNTNQSITLEEIQTIIAAIADGYSFPTNLDTNPPTNGTAPETAQQLMTKALDEKWDLNRFNQALDKYAQSRRA